MTRQVQPDSTASLHVLRLGAAMGMAGFGAITLQYSSALFSWLWLGHGWSESAAQGLERAGACLVIAAIPFLFWRRAWLAPAMASIWLAFSTWAAAETASWQAWLVPFAGATRVLAPAAVAVWAFTGPDKRLQGLLRVATAFTFAAHGVEALLGRGLFVDYAIGVLARVGIAATQSGAESMLRVIGVVDCASAAALLLPRRWRWLALWMAAWGFFTAALRMLHGGWAAWPESVVRLPNAALPFCLYLIWKPPCSKEPSSALCPTPQP
ncbi:MAG: hypothetical protein IPP14_08250 [Planctomycetes bacterium]|nr:hypothetical protein [Planctomycetota bacterium]